MLSTMRIVALMNQKGGVGKTTTTVNLGAALAEAGQRVLLIDLDPQAHLTINYGIEPEGAGGQSASTGTEVAATVGGASLYDVLVGDQPLSHAIRPAHFASEADNSSPSGAQSPSDPKKSSRSGKVFVAPSGIDLAAAEVEMVSVLGRELVLKKKLTEVANQYDWVLMDCPPSLGLLTINALAAATEVLIPMQPHFLALQGVGKLLETVQMVSKRMNPALKVNGIVLTMWDGQAKLSGEVVFDLQNFIDQAKGKNLPWSDARIYQTRIRRNIKLAESPSFGKTILGYEPTSNGAADYRALALEVLTAAGVPIPAALKKKLVAAEPQPS